MELDYFTNLPSEITTDILSRLPLRSRAIIKCVCKGWLNLLESDDFVKSHLSKIKTPPVLVRIISTEFHSTRCTIFEIEDEDEANTESNDLHYIMQLSDFNIPHAYLDLMAGISVNGLILLYSEVGYATTPLYICNPITRQYIQLSCPEEYILKEIRSRFGFGVSKLSGQYKVVCFNADAGSDSHYVYTLGTRTWRRVEAGAASGFRFFSGIGCTICNGNLHWMAYDRITPYLCGFDVETECFSIFSAPFFSTHLWTDGPEVILGELSVLRDHLCYCYTCGDEIVIWSMKEYRVEESWAIEYRLSSIDFDRNEMSYVYPIKAFKNGDILMLLDNKRLFYYSNKTRTTKHVGMFKDPAAEEDNFYPLMFTPSLFSFKNIGIEKVILF